MRRFRQQLPDDEAKAILRNCTGGVLSLVGSDGRPYGVPMSYAFDGESAIFFHCAPEGKKLDCVDFSPNASFCVIERDEVQPSTFTTHYRSAIAQGRVRRVDDADRKEAALRLLAGKYSPGFDPEGEIAGALSRVVVLRFDIETLTAKEAIELVRQKNVETP